MEGIERLRVMAMNGGSMQKQYFKIFMYLKKRTDMDEKFQNPEKSFEQMYEYIKGEVKKQAVNGVAMVEDVVVYGLAVHYFDESNEDLGIKKKEIVTKKIAENKQEIPKSEEPKKEEREQISLFEGKK